MTTSTLHTRSTKNPESRKDVSLLNIAVLAGGPGAERDVSLQSGRAVADALTRRGHSVQLLDICPENLSALDAGADVFFVALHGDFGEDGKVQLELDARNLVYCGSAEIASRLAMDKVATKQLAERHGILTPAYEVATGKTGFTMKPPCVVKPINSGSSVDVCIAGDDAQLTAAVEELGRKYDRLLIESYIKGPELTVGVLDGVALPVCEIRTKREFYDYLAKYVDYDTEYRFDIDLPANTLKMVQDLSVKTANVVGCRDFCRVDWMVDAADNQPFMIEVNTIPGFTSHSLLPKAAARAGMEFDELCERIVRLALDRCPDDIARQPD
jgi:D-alanine-D-alanine ligase